MNETTPLSRDSKREAKPVMVRVWDSLVRLLHWSLAAGFAIAYVIEDDWLPLHVWTGYVILGLVSVRVLWGFTGSRHARWSDFVKAPGEILAYLKAIFRSGATRYLGHNPAGGAMVIALLVSLVATGLSGLALYGGQELSGPLASVLGGMPEGRVHVLEDLHEVLANLTLLLVVLHVGGVVLTGLQHRENLIVAMITGYKRRHSP